MDNQHRKITGYRDLTQEEIDLVNRVKEAEQQALALLSEMELIKLRHDDMQVRHPEQKAEDFPLGCDLRAMNIARTQLQTGFMWLTRAVTQPDAQS